MSDDESEPVHHPSPKSRRNSIAFWLLGLCNNFAYVIMLSAAKDILQRGSPEPVEQPCRQDVYTRHCQEMSTGSILLADIIPAMIVKFSAPLYVHYIPFGIRHLLVVALQAGSFLLVATSESTFLAIVGVALASAGSGFGEVTYLALTSHYDSGVVQWWSSGTGGAGLLGSLAYAFLTEKSFLAFSLETTMFIMLIIPGIFAVSYWWILLTPPTVQKVVLSDRSTYVLSGSSSSRSRGASNERERLIDDDDDEDSAPTEPPMTLREKIKHSTMLLKYIVPLVLVYFGEYFINQGLLELIEFPCEESFWMNAESQYRWYQVTYQIGVFISRSSAPYLTLKLSFLMTLAGLQLFNVIIFTTASLHPILPHISLAFIAIFYEGLLGGAAYVNTFKAVHRDIVPSRREFSMGVVSISDTIGIMSSGFLAMPVHNYICARPFQLW